MAFIRRANLDALWAREPSTVSANLREAIRMEKFTSELDLPSVTPPMGPFPLNDDFGMLPAIALLDRSLAPGIHSEYVQWGTFRRAMSVVTNVTQAGVGGLAVILLERTREIVHGYRASPHISSGTAGLFMASTSELER